MSRCAVLSLREDILSCIVRRFLVSAILGCYLRCFSILSFSRGCHPLFSMSILPDIIRFPSSVSPASHAVSHPAVHSSALSHRVSFFLPLRDSGIPLVFVYYVQIVFGHFFVLCASRQARVSFSSFTGQSDCPFPFGIPVFRDTEIPFFHPQVLCSQMSLRASATEK